jgi:hypothetical protein|tara:strand:+ start:28389 stop:28502 length:114 start_codon:yes stop_codon:yes gene_type:complete
MEGLTNSKGNQIFKAPENPISGAFFGKYRPDSALKKY